MKKTSDHPLTFQEPSVIAEAFALFLIMIFSILFGLAFATVITGGAVITGIARIPMNEIGKIVGLITIGSLAFLLLRVVFGRGRKK